ncbi:GNAT family N-acetyltransferase [Catellatospora sichuanensis]|uniref:GNAT family N-acetyltransferase n=1 Tax=Catellatospora sichuanensis TaxID=1969805 RepID=UPI0011837870|nr:GNAT family N-acetyltransferase [Catellatospora sichuanensis]
MTIIRPYRPSDHDAVYDICIRTAHHGGDARPHYRDPGILPEIFALPYAHLEPQFAFVLADADDRAVGYVLATGDTGSFVERFRHEWLPLVADRYPPLDDAEPRDGDEVMRHLLHRPERMVVPALAAYPAHLHIDLLPEHQRQGHGRALMGRLVLALQEAGVPAVHLGMVSENTAARAFYDRLGMHVIDVPDSGPLTYLGLKV